MVEIGSFWQRLKLFSADRKFLAMTGYFRRGVLFKKGLISKQRRCEKTYAAFSAMIL